MLCTERAELLIIKDHDKDLVRMLDVIDSIVMNFESNSSADSETTCYRKTAHILDIIFKTRP